MESSLFRLPALVSALLIAMGPHAFAEVSAQGTPEVVHVEVKNASLDEVLRALHDACGLAYRSGAPLDARISGTYEGPLSRVIARLLEGRNYVLTKSNSNFQLVIVGEAGSPPIPPAVAAPIPAPGGNAGRTYPMPAGLFPPPVPLPRAVRDR